MYIDNCKHTFAELAYTILPAHMTRLRDAMQKSRPANIFSNEGAGPMTVARELGIARDFSGCYVLIDRARPFYIGISRKVLSRLRQHFRGKSHFDASLAYSIAKRRIKTTGHRSAAMQLPDFRNAFVDAQLYLRNLTVAFVEIENPLELYVFEAYAAMELGTHEWNTFRTH